MVGIGELRILSGQRVTVQLGEEENRAVSEQLQQSTDYVGKADLVLLYLQLRLASDSRHMSQRDLYLGRCPLWDT